ncbi:hypothetical protein K438DRAFT_2008424 [Mycena galopus ATCC 62051]|nr:hypothetical protein K438DRAFT_2008424 [Mycena galopus ATCC 62051]
MQASLKPTLTTELDISEIQRLSKPVLEDGQHILGLASDPCVWPGISALFASFLAGLGAPVVVISSLKSTRAIVPSSTTSPTISLVAQTLLTLLGTEPEDVAGDSGLASPVVTDDSHSVRHFHFLAAFC